MIEPHRQQPPSFFRNTFVVFAVESELKIVSIFPILVDEIVGNIRSCINLNACQLFDYGLESVMADTCRSSIVLNSDQGLARVAHECKKILKVTFDTQDVNKLAVPHFVFV